MYDADQRDAFAAELAEAFLTAPWKRDAVAESGAARLDRWPGWMEALAIRVIAVFPAPPVEREFELIALIDSFLAEHAPWPGESEPPQILRLLVSHRTARSGPLVHDWPLAEIDSVANLAERLELSDGQLAWLADVRSLERSAAHEKLRNYRYRIVPRRGGLPRVLEAPKARLKEIQRWILYEILAPVPPHEAAQGFTRGRSVATHAGLHSGQEVVLRLDLKDFFASVTAGRVFGIFRTLGYGRSVAHVLTALSTNTIPQAVWHAVPRATDAALIEPRFWLGRALSTPHLPQGAPTSPALANLAGFRLDRRLTGLANSAGLRYSRYADDLTFSGPVQLRRRRRHLEALVAEITREEGFVVNERKTALHSAGGRQSVCGIVVNVRPNVLRSEYDQLKAILHNVATHGPSGQNRAGTPDFEAHLRGRIAWVASLNPARGEKLRRRFAEIRWDDR
ncbi:MAG TPA: reverse transcriptase family protein [Solirubrobacteraceae bacterium]|nr:reverse transcriptase family protein [Solirubrobacteraceae bacterium]